MTFAAIGAAARRHGLMPRGGFHPGPDDGAPPGAGTIVMIGNAGPAMWRAFAAARPAGPDPLNRWTRAVLDPLAARFDGAMLYPFDGPPHAPFLAWAKRAEAVHDSPLGLAVHPVHGLWHAWRGALVLPERLDLPPRGDAPSPCIGCATRPCLTACPVDAFAGGGYDMAACAGHLRRPEGADCLALGCRARHACPVGQDDRYAPAQAALHMAAFLKGQNQA